MDIINSFGAIGRAIIDNLHDTLQSFGFVQKTYKVLFLGIGNSGNSSLLSRLMHPNEPLDQNIPYTYHPRSEDITYENLNFVIFDLGSHPSTRRMWKDYFEATDAIVYTLDTSASTEEMQEAKQDLDYLFSFLAPTVPVLIFGNKIDAPNAIREEALGRILGLENTTGKGFVTLNETTRPIEVFMCSVLRGQGYQEGFHWLSKHMQN